MYEGGREVKATSAVTLASDSSLTSGLGVFETLLWDGEQLCEVEEHLERAKRSLATILDEELPSADLLSSVEQFLKTQGQKNFRVRLTFSKALSGLRVLVSAAPYTRPSSNVCLTLSPFKLSETRPTVGHKVTSYADFSLALKQAHADGFDEALLLNSQDQLCETCTANIFFGDTKLLHTPALRSGCLPGVMRQRVINAARQLGIEVREGDYTVEDFRHADSSFMSNSLRRVQPIASCDDIAFVPFEDCFLASLDATH